MFKFESTSTDLQTEQDYPTVVFTLQDEASLYSMIEAFEAFLRASGYSFNGHLEITEGEELNPDSLDEICENCRTDLLEDCGQETNDQIAGDDKGFIAEAN